MKAAHFLPLLSTMLLPLELQMLMVDSTMLSLIFNRITLLKLDALALTTSLFINTNVMSLHPLDLILKVK